MGSGTKVVVAIVGVLVGLGIVAAIASSSREAALAPDRARLAQLGQELTAAKATVAEQEQQLDALGARIEAMDARIAGLRASAEEVERRNSTGVPRAQYEAYSRTVDNHNALVREQNTLIDQYQALYADYSARVDSHNAQVEEANALNTKLGAVSAAGSGASAGTALRLLRIATRLHR